MSQQSYAFMLASYLLVCLCITMIVIQHCHAWNDDLLTLANEDKIKHRLVRRYPKTLTQILHEILQRGEIQIQPHRLNELRYRLDRQKHSP
ncbi:unnamed protein product [Adineta ricciae]|uniref:Uncharacterized protein n=1 Tax=Adineta ricciae TaxID=249248 RepID=A0A814Q4U6_ADIRI|nr:unnamed protein product [Adineta ricciae]CAF1114713.1 unnamed protein product [Adineta ricciae]